jgi:hypothetical protein
MHNANIIGMSEKIIEFDEFSPGNVPLPHPNSADDIRTTFEKSPHSGRTPQ